MKRLLTAIFSAVLALPASAELEIGAKAADFTTRAALGGKVFDYSLAAALKDGPVVLYFYPAAFTSGCTIEAHAFAESIGDFKALGATVIGVSHDDIETLSRFSVSECRSKFPVAADTDQRIMKAYDAVLLGLTSYAKRTSYVIAPDGTILYRYTAMNPEQHVANTLAAVKQWAQTRQ